MRELELRDTTKPGPRAAAPIPVDNLCDLEPEVFGLNWPGKAEAKANANASSPTLDQYLVDEIGAPAPHLALNDSAVISGDNLPVMKLLLPSHREQVGVIYIDPPYNTGNDFGYCDNYRESTRSKTPTADAGAFTAASARLHTRWLSMMLPRLLVARQLLSNDGIICISIDDNEIDKLRLIMAEIFGEKNFLGQVTVLSNPRGRQAEKHFAAVHEYLLIFAKDASLVKLGGTELTEKQAAEFKYADGEDRKYRLLGLRQRGAASRQEDRPALHYPIYVNPDNGRISLHQDNLFRAVAWPKKSTGAPGRWMWGKERLSNEVENVEARIITQRNEWDVFVRDYISDGAGTQRTRKISTIWMEPELNYQNGKRELKQLIGSAPVDYPKPLALIKKVIGLVDKPDGLVMDFFAGTGTTGQAVLEMNAKSSSNRRFILIQQPEPLNDPQFSDIAALCAERVRRSIASLNSHDDSTEYGGNDAVRFLALKHD